MDSKNQPNLTPELKEIYDRVMTSSPALNTAPATPQPTVVKPQTPPPPTTPSSQTLSTPSVAEDALSSVPPRPISDIGVKPFSFSGTAPTPPKPEKHEEKAIAQTAPPTSPTESTAASSSPQKKSAISLPLILGLSLMFIIVWSFFWLVFLGFIKF